MELPLEFLASFLLGYAVQQAPQIADRVGWPVTIVLIANMIRMAHGSAQIRTDETLRRQYVEQVEKPIRIFWKTAGDLCAAVLALMFTFAAVNKLGGQDSFCAINSMGWSLSSAFQIEENECMTVWLFVPYLAYMFWDGVIFVATFDSPGSIGSLWSTHDYRKFSIVWIATHVTVLVCLIFLPHVASDFGLKTCYAILGTTIIIIDYTVNRGFYFPRHFVVVET